MDSGEDRKAWSDHKSHLKAEFARWAIRAEDARQAKYAWNQYLAAADRRPADTLQMFSFLQLVAISYGRVFTGRQPIQAAPPYVRRSDQSMHAQLMDLRHQGVAHSDLSYRSLRVLPPGASSPGLPTTPAHQITNYHWLIRGVELEGDREQITLMIAHLSDQLDAKAKDAFSRLMEHCKDSIVPSVETPIDQF